ncbi:MAG: hypothetical protein ACLQGP_14625 [Isosphaeraceae bacterium]
MNLHLHHSRNVMGWILGIAAFSPFALIFDSSDSKYTLSDVTGRVTYSGRPLSDVIICLDTEGGVHSAFGSLGPDGSFRLLNMDAGSVGAFPGRYHAHLYNHSQASNLPEKYSNPKTSGIEIEIDSDWSDLHIDLH